MKNKIAYIYFLPTKSSIGVFEKPKRQYEAIKDSEKINFDIFVLNKSKNNKIDGLEYINIYEKYNPIEYYFRVIFCKGSIIKKYIPLDDYKIIIMRYPGSDISVLNLAEEHNIIFELHSKMIETLRLKLKYNCSIFRKLYRKFKISKHKKYHFKILEKSLGVICNGYELKEYLNNKMNKFSPIKVLPNGVDVTNVEVTGFRKFNGKKMNIGILLSRADKWHGVRRLIKSINKYAKEIDYNINLHIIGGVEKGAYNHINRNNKLKIIYHGIKTGKELNVIMNKLNLGVCPLALFKKNLHNTSAIKIVEYFSRGLPFIIGYKDTCIFNDEFNGKYYIRFSNDESIMNINKITNFCTKISQSQDKVIRGMRNFAENHLDWSIILKKYYNFALHLYKH